MDQRLVILISVVILLTISFCGCLNSRSTDYFNEDYYVEENTILSVSTVNGQIEIIGWDEDYISFNAVKKSNFGRDELDLVKIDVNQDEGEIDIEAYYIGDRASQPSVDMNIKIPSFVFVDMVSSSNGAIDIFNVKGDLKASTSNGGIFINGVEGYVTASTSNGRIEIEDTDGVYDLTSSNLGINAEVYYFLEDIEISTSNGAIELYINPSLNANLDIRTSNGFITVDDDLDLIISLSEDKHKTGQLGFGGNNIDIHTSNGNIRIYKLDV
jgi:DUF4097 and DUF4098 domain-containing protein YvlB